MDAHAASLPAPVAPSNRDHAPVGHETFGVHMMLDCYEADPARLADAGLLTGMMTSLVTRLSMHAIHEPVVVEVGPMNRKDPGGLSGFILIAESHISFHTFPKRRFATIDVYTCHGSLPEEDVVAELRRHLCFASHEAFVQSRGRRYPAANLID